jgi:hypothetical protein
MRNVLEIICESYVNIELDNINNKLICESLQSSILQDLVKQITTKRNTQKANDSWYISPVFKDLFRYTNVTWDKITDEDFIISKRLNNDETDKKLIKERNNIEKLVKKLINNDLNALVLLQSPSSNEFTYFINNYGSMYYIENAHILTKRSTSYSRSNAEITKTEKMGIVRDSNIYLIDLNTFSSNKIQIKRREDRDGMIYLDEQSLRDLARKNVERYKEIIARNKASRLAKQDNMAELVGEIVNRVMELSQKINADISKYADLVYPITSIIHDIYSTRQYHKGTVTGHDGLLPVFSGYMKSKSSALSNSNNMTDYYQRDSENYLIKLKDIINNLEDKLDDLEDKL